MQPECGLGSAANQVTSVSKFCGEICMAHRLMYHTGQCRFLHGHNYAITVELSGPVRMDSGMVLDFSVLKQKVKQFIDLMDHKTMLYGHDPLVRVLVDNEYGDHLFIVPFHPTVENIAGYIFNGLIRGGLSDVLHSVTVMETNSSFAKVTKA